MKVLHYRNNGWQFCQKKDRLLPFTPPSTIHLEKELLSISCANFQRLDIVCLIKEFKKRNLSVCIMTVAQ